MYVLAPLKRGKLEHNWRFQLLSHTGYVAPHLLATLVLDLDRDGELEGQTIPDPSLGARYRASNGTAARSTDMGARERIAAIKS